MQTANVPDPTAMIVFGEPFDVTTGMLDKTPRVAFTVNEHVTVYVATREPDAGFIAGCYVAPAVTRPTLAQVDTLAAVGLTWRDGISLPVDVPSRLWERFYRRLIEAGAPLAPLTA